MYGISTVNRVAIGDIIRRSASRYPEKTAFIQGDQKWNFSEVDRLCNQFANYLLESGLTKGDKIATICGNSMEFIITMFGIAKAGLIWVPINPGISFDEKKYILEKVKAKLLIGDEVLLKNQLEYYKSQVQTLQLDGRVSEFFSLFEDFSEKEPSVEIQDRDVAQIMFTSGTTGNPKGVMISHLTVYMASLANIIEMGLKPSDVTTALMPLFHCAQHTFVTSFLNIGATSIIFKGFDPEGLMKTIEQEKITWMFMLPMMYRAILHHPNRGKYDLTSLNTCMYAMAPMDRPTLEKLIKEFDADFALGTGQTEIYPSTLMFKPEEQLRRFGSYWGVSSLINDTAVMDEEGNILPAGQIGEIVHRGPNVMNGYLDSKEETDASRQFDWHHTGDLGYWDKDGQMVFVDRKKDLIKTGGENVASIKVEQVLLMHEKVANAVAIGLPHEHWVEAVTAFIVPKENETLSEKEIADHCRQHLGNFQVPKAFVFVESLPMTTTGKIQKHVLRTKHKDLYAEVQS
ncbi:AMP-dependent synthetase [Bacillus sp. M6-12]|uniref:AMP-binding protein n=1 Tax=Bacillus sp. M6-12 TaxID=2054166 RepID=UPI000C77FE72|nr:AMP-binding protein [Bacillus sp. M6-12]PLS18662.1 AMP-dependent synthetase [Bacillus sp. M6-12]